MKGRNIYSEIINIGSKKKYFLSQIETNITANRHINKSLRLDIERNNRYGQKIKR